MKKITFTGLAFLILSGLLAHEFWLQPARYFLQPGDRTTVTLFVGENFTGEAWAKRASRTATLLHFAPSDTINLTDIAKKDDSTAITINTAEAGTHLLYLHSNPSFIALDAQKFNAYLKEDGLDNILALRKQNNQLHLPAREHYERFAKSIVQVGNTYTSQYQTATGGLLDMQLSKNPYQVKIGSSFSVTSKFDGVPLKNKKVVAWHKSHSGKYLGKTVYNTNDKGEINFTPTGRGIWMISTVHMVPAQDSSYDYHSYWGSVTFAIK
jgi:uncharacterized GH25 family protein